MNTLKQLDKVIVARRAHRRPTRATPHPQALLLADAGQSLVEFALVLPLFLIIVTGIFAFGLAFNNWLILTEATSVGARSVAISRGQTLDPCRTAVQAFQGAAPGLNPANLNFTFLFNGVAASGTSCGSGSSTTGHAADLVQGQTAQMNVTYSCSLQVYRGNYGSSCLLHAQTTEVVY